MEDKSDILHTELCGLKDIVDERLKNVFDICNRIEKQTTKTNGRVTDLENRRVKNLEVWKGFITGGLALMTLLVVPMVIIVFAKFIG